MPTKEAKDAHSLSSLSPQKRSKMLTKEAQIAKKKKKGPKMPLFLSP
jgi:hypothetical protein